MSSLWCSLCLDPPLIYCDLACWEHSPCYFANLVYALWPQLEIFMPFPWPSNGMYAQKHWSFTIYLQAKEKRESAEDKERKQSTYDKLTNIWQGISLFSWSSWQNPVMKSKYCPPGTICLLRFPWLTAKFVRVFITDVTLINEHSNLSLSLFLDQSSFVTVTEYHQ